MPRRMMKTGLAALGALAMFGAATALAQPDCQVAELKNDSAKDGGNGWVCPCFIPDEVAMAVLTVPDPSDGNELLTLQILWDSYFGGPDVTIEKALIVYDMNQDGPVDPNSFSVIASFEDPELHRGFLNVFDVSAYGIVLPERRFGVGIKFANDKTKGGGTDQPSVVEDFDGHNNWDNTIRNWVYAIPGGWKTAQSLGTSGDWIIRATVNSCLFGSRFRLDSPVPGVAGQVNTLAVSGAEPGGKVHFAYSLRAGQTPLPGCDGVVLDMRKPVVIDTLTANANGDVDLNVKVPLAAKGLTVLFQAVQAKPVCEVTNLVVQVFE